MKATWISILLVACFVAPPIVLPLAAKDHGISVKYDGGSLPSIKVGTELKLYVERDQVRFEAGKKDEPVVIQASSITEISYGQGAKKHYVGLTWADEEHIGGLALQCNKKDYRGVLAALEGVSGKQAVNSDTMTVKNGSAPKPADPTRPATNSEAHTRQEGRASADAPNQPGLYALVSSGLEHIVGRVTSFERSGSRLASAATVGIVPSRVNIQIAGARARITVGARPIFYYRTPEHQDIGGLDLVLTRMTVNGERRQFEVAANGLWRGSSGVSVRHQIAYDAIEVAPGLYKLTPAHELEKGQYAFYLLRGREHASTKAGQGFVFDFQVA
jgi:hypothetical protein